MKHEKILDARFWLLDTPIPSSIEHPEFFQIPIRVYPLHKFRISNCNSLRYSITGKVFFGTKVLK